LLFVEVETLLFTVAEDLRVFTVPLFTVFGDAALRFTDVVDLLWLTAPVPFLAATLTDWLSDLLTPLFVFLADIAYNSEPLLLRSGRE
jgi:hypothetical protein